VSLLLDYPESDISFVQMSIQFTSLSVGAPWRWGLFHGLWWGM